MCYWNSKAGGRGEGSGGDFEIVSWNPTIKVRLACERRDFASRFKSVYETCHVLARG